MKNKRSLFALVFSLLILFIGTAGSPHASPNSKPVKIEIAKEVSPMLADLQVITHQGNESLTHVFLSTEILNVETPVTPSIEVRNAIAIPSPAFSLIQIKNKAPPKNMPLKLLINDTRLS